MADSKDLYGILVDFDNPEDLLAAVQKAYKAGFRKMDTYTPFPVDGVIEALGQRHTRISAVVLTCGIVGGCLGYFMQWFASVVQYPHNIGGKPMHSWPAFIPVTFEMTVLFAAFGAVIGMLALNGLPKPYHPVFNAPEFEAASLDRFFLCIESKDQKFDAVETKRFLNELKPIGVYEVAE